MGEHGRRQQDDIARIITLGFQPLWGREWTLNKTTDFCAGDKNKELAVPIKCHNYIAFFLFVSRPVFKNEAQATRGNFPLQFCWEADWKLEREKAEPQSSLELPKLAIWVCARGAQFTHWICGI